MSALKASAAGIAMLTGAAAQSPPSATTFGSFDIGKNTLAVTMQGQIESGDEARLRQFLQTLAATGLIGVWAMSSPGGDVRKLPEDHFRKRYLNETELGAEAYGCC